MKQIFWKEWRENWVIVVLGIIIISALTYIFLSLPRVSFILSQNPKALFLPILFFIAILGANLFSTEFSNNTIPFLLMHPMARSKLWLTKVICGLILILLLSIGSGIGMILVSYLTPKPFSFADVFLWEKEALPYILVTVGLIYSVTLFISILIPNTVVAVFTSLISAYLIGSLWMKSFIIVIYYYPSLEKWLAELWIPIILLLASSWLTFVRSELLLTKQRIRFGITFLFICFLILAVGIIAYTTIDIVPLSSISTVKPEIIIPEKNLALVQIEKTGKPELYSRLWLVSLKDHWYKKYPGQRFYTLYFFKTNSVSPNGDYVILEHMPSGIRVLLKRVYPSMAVLNTNTYRISYIPIKETKGMAINYVPLAWTADNRKVLYYYEVRGKTETQQIRLADVYNKEDKRICFFPMRCFQADWAPDSTSIFVQYFPEISFDKSRKDSISGVAQINLEGKALWTHTQYGPFPKPLLSPNKKWLLFTESTTDQSILRNVYLKNTFTNETSLILQAQKIRLPQWSPDSRWIAIPALTSASGKTKDIYSVWLVNLETKEKTQVLSSKFNIRLAGWSPDSRWIAILVPDEEKKSVYSLWIVNSETKEKIKLLSSEVSDPGEGKVVYPIEPRSIVWSTDGRKIFFRRASEVPAPTGEINIYTREIRCHKWWLFDAFQLPDGRFLIAEGNRLYIFSPEEKEMKQIFPPLKSR